MVQVVRGVIGAGLVLGLGALPAVAQSVALPASDAVGISRSGTAVAFGYSLEAATLNPALLASLKDPRAFYLAGGLELEVSQLSLESNQRTLYSSDRNRSLVGFGASFRMSPTFTLGLKLDEPFLRHAQLPAEATSRFMGDGIDLSARRFEAQAAWALRPNLSVGLGLGVARLSYQASTTMRFGVPVDPSQQISGTNVIQGLVEQRISEEGTKTVPSFSLGLRWAINTRWTFGATYQSGLKGDLSMKAGLDGSAVGTYANDGYGLAPAGTTTRATTLLALVHPVAGNPSLELPSRTTLGLRHRVNTMITWETDLHWTGAGQQMPGFARADTPSGSVFAPVELPTSRGHLGLSGAFEVELGKFWTLRAGLALEQRAVDRSLIEPLVGGAPQAGFSAGAGYKVWGGELSFGYQFRQSQDQDTRRLDGTWSSAGYRPTGAQTRVEGMGHLIAFGFKRSF